MTTTAETAAWLRAVADEVEQDPSRWWKYDYAADASGRRVDCDNPCACRWCAEGFILRDDRTFSSVLPCLSRAAGCSPSTSSVANYNDSLPDASAAVAWFRRAAELAEKEGRDG